MAGFRFALPRYGPSPENVGNSCTKCIQCCFVIFLIFLGSLTGGSQLPKHLHIGSPVLFNGNASHCERVPKALVEIILGSLKKFELNKIATEPVHYSLSPCANGGLQQDAQDCSVAGFPTKYVQKRPVNLNYFMG